MVGKYSMTLEFLTAISAVNFEIQGTNYNNIEAVLQPYAHRLTEFQENFSFNKETDGSESCSHNLIINYRPAQGQDGIQISKDIAEDIFYNNKPNFPYVKDLIDYDAHIDSTGDSYTETYDKISGRCSFTRSFVQNPTSSSAGEITFLKTYSLSRESEGFTSVSEKVELKNKFGVISSGSTADATLRASYDLSFSNCQSKVASLGYSGVALINISSEVSKFRSEVDGRLGYEVSYTDNPRVSVSGYTIDRKYTLDRGEDGVVSISSEHTAKPLSKRIISGTNLATARSLLVAGVNNSIIYNYSGTLKLTEESHNRTSSGSRYVYKRTDTDDTTIFLHDNSTLFAKKEVNVDNDAPLRMHEVYQIASLGEVIHMSPQSNLGTLKISFQGQIKRNKTYNHLIYGQIYNQNAAIAEAANTTLAYFGSVINPTQLFIVDTNYGVDSDGQVTLDVQLQYTKASLTRILETRT
jgi:hypothetical protein